MQFIYLEKSLNNLKRNKMNKYDTQQHIIVWIMILIPLLCLFLCD